MTLPAMTIRELTTDKLATSRHSFGQNQFALPRFAQSIDLPVVLDPNLVATTSQLVEFDDLW